ncbi:M15 family metallopeptidase [Phytoactinopolyspora halotolerans]|uniref:M15 family metallopeptidase n=1 Tax=Phytoactinopolyspora halotolerans TaxID=1981512 RepID=A0A6L9SHS6_9ACTN|nr:M15 family metallopeptidase [Phytoactinopolyspora halotolerans]NEE04749.1 M15 family metallopeptidase [Phytoactinopolyspora halotolerans]
MRSIIAALVTTLAVGGVVLSGIVLLLPSDSEPSEGTAAPPTSSPTTSPMTESRGSPAPDDPKDDGDDEFDRTRHSTTDPTSIWVVVNKRHPIQPEDFRPEEMALVRGYQVAKPAAEPLEQLLADSDEQGLGFKIGSAFRSYEYQQSVYADTVAARGQAAADQVSARPGHSEHQTGLAVDLVTPDDPACSFETCFGETPGGRWLAENAWRYGFIIRYQRSLTEITGYSYEPWHLRFVGRPLAAELRRTGIATLEEFFDIPGGDYGAG